MRELVLVMFDGKCASVRCNTRRKKIRRCESKQEIKNEGEQLLYEVSPSGTIKIEDRL